MTLRFTALSLCSFEPEGNLFHTAQLLILGKATMQSKVLESTPLLEAFGNARTRFNDNSSRFGRFIKIAFSRGGHLRGASVHTYLLGMSVC